MTTNIGGRRAPHSAAYRRLQRSGRQDTDRTEKWTFGCWLLRSACGECVRHKIRGRRRSWPPAAACSAAGREPNTRHQQHSPVLAVGLLASHSLYGSVDRRCDEELYQPGAAGPRTRRAGSCPQPPECRRLHPLSAVSDAALASMDMVRCAALGRQGLPWHGGQFAGRK